VTSTDGNRGDMIKGLFDAITLFDPQRNSWLVSLSADSKKEARPDATVATPDAKAGACKLRTTCRPLGRGGDATCRCALTQSLRPCYDGGSIVADQNGLRLEWVTLARW